MNKVQSMKHNLLNFWLVLFGLLLCVPAAYGDQASKAEKAQGARTAQYSKPIWGQKANRQTGLYTIRNKSVGNGFCLNVGALYYYGDVDMLDQAFVHGFQTQNLSIGGGVHFCYLHPLARFVNMRFSLGGGYLHGNDSARTETRIVKGKEISASKGHFSSIFGELDAGVEFYPFPRAGFYIYAGLGLAVSYINYNFENYGIEPGNTVSLLPMLPVEIGYNFYLGGSCFLGIWAACHQGLMDMGKSNLDAWPLESSAKFQWGDGYFQLGISFSYRWHNCETCRHLKW